ncbi:uncharacterized protein LOC106644885 [Copidosoma floridanum]|uniref:uncharacterized protein LOC106644885 n=1 Tax=Copidosoma floridanum TaxID=29053 RepID=UPI000C6FA232|nr:uncharacterized protein LOC106644885 [Copidosoma floridanum]
MADVATKTKSMSVVSNNSNSVNGKTKMSDVVVCGVQSNNGLIDLVGPNNCLSNNASNNKLITLRSPNTKNNDDNEEEEEEEDDLILANNARNELDSQEDKSLQELIESELALRISANNGADDTSEDEASEIMNTQPEITKTIILEPRQDPEVDVNHEFIVNEMDHYSLIGEPMAYEYSNGHVGPNPIPEVVVDEAEEEEEELGDGQTETTETEVTTTTTSGPSLPSAYEATELDHDEVDRQEQPVAKGVSNGSAVTAEKCLEEDARDDPDDGATATFVEHEVGAGEEECLSVKEASGVDEKACSFYTTEGLMVDNDEGVGGDEPTVGVTHYQLKAGDDGGDRVWITVEEAVKEPGVGGQGDESLQERTNEGSEMFYSQESRFENYLDRSSIRLEGDGKELAPLATPDEISDISNANDDSESREEVITTSSVVSTATKKKKKIEGSAASDASPNHTKTKKTKKSKKSELEKENISVKKKIKSKDSSKSSSESMRTASSRQPSAEMIEISGEDDLSNINVKSLTETYVSETNRVEPEKSNKEIIATGVSIKQLCRSFGDVSNMSDTDRPALGVAENNKFQERAKSTGDLSLFERQEPSKYLTTRDIVFATVNVKALKTSFNKFDALAKKSASAAVLHVRSVDAGKVHQQLNAVSVSNGEVNPNCRSCGKVVFQMEQTKAEGLVWHKNCFRCVQCSKQLSVDNYESHEATLYCKPHFRELFQPKPVEETDQTMRPRKPEMIIRENQPKELPPDVVRASDKPDLGLDELSSLNVKSRFQVFEKANEPSANDIERSPSQVAVKRSPSILSKLAKFQAKGMNIGVADEQLNGIPYEESSDSEGEEEEEETEETESETAIVKAKRGSRERPMSFTKMCDMKNRWETTSQQGRRESQREARKEEMAGIRSRLFMGKQGKMKEMYQQAVADSERVTKINAAEEIQHATNARSIKERFERGEPIAASDEELDAKNKPEKADEEILAAGISRKSRSLFLELDASAAKTGRPVTPNSTPKSGAETPRRARDVFMGRQVSDDVVRSSDTTEEVQVDVSDISNKFKFFESYREPEKMRKQFRITPPRDGQVKMDSPDREIYRDPDVVRAEDRAEDVVRTDTARKMLSIFRQMEEKATKEELPEGPKPLKRFTPPPEDKFAKPSMSDDDEDEEAEESEDEEHNPNYVRASDKVEDEFLKQAQNAARAKTLRAKFEHWEEEADGKANHHHVAEMDYAQTDGNQPSIESASSLRARFESLGSQPAETPRAPKVKVNRFVEIQTNCMDVCESCEKKVYPLEKVETNNKIFHKQCFRCLRCNCILRMDTFTLNNGKLYCIPHFKQLFITRGNYDEGFGVDPHKNKWSNSGVSPTSTMTTTTPQAASPAPIAVSNGDV